MPTIPDKKPMPPPILLDNKTESFVFSDALFDVFFCKNIKIAAIIKLIPSNIKKVFSLNLIVPPKNANGTLAILRGPIFLKLR